MITSAYVRMMSAYNAEMNVRIYASATRLPDAERRLDRGAFWRSIHGTLSHLLWGDKAWMARFDPDRCRPPSVSLEQSGDAFSDFDEMSRIRLEQDVGISDWANALDDDWLLHDQSWFSGAAGREITKPRALLVTHLFNHQTHHRGQVHAMLTAAGETTGATDLPLMPGLFARP